MGKIERVLTTSLVPSTGGFCTIDLLCSRCYKDGGWRTATMTGTWCGRCQQGRECWRQVAEGAPPSCQAWMQRQTGQGRCESTEVRKGRLGGGVKSSPKALVEKGCEHRIRSWGACAVFHSTHVPVRSSTHQQGGPAPAPRLGVPDAALLSSPVDASSQQVTCGSANKRRGR